MGFHDDIDVWANGSANKTTPNTAEIAAGHPANSVANSAWVNERSGVRDAKINAANNAAQAGTLWYPVDINDKVRVAAELQHTKIYSPADPDGALCKLSISQNIVAACPGWDYDNDAGCVYLVYAGDVDYIYRVNTWGVGALAADALDLDLSNVSSISCIASDGPHLYIGYKNSSTGDFHVAQIDLATWTGLALYDQDTGWSNAAGFIDISVPNYGTLGVFFHDASTTATFGMWTPGTSWLTGGGNVSQMGTAVKNSSSDFDALYSTNGALMTFVRGNDDVLYLVGCDVTNPATYANVPTTKQLSGVVTNNSALLTFASRFLFFDAVGNISTYADDGSANWSTNIASRSAAGVGFDRATSTHRPRMCLDGCGRLWVLYRADASVCNSGDTSLIAVAYNAHDFEYTGVNPGNTAPPTACVRLNQLETDSNSGFWMMSDGRNLVVIVREGFSTPSPQSYIRVVTCPGLR